MSLGVLVMIPPLFLMCYYGWLFELLDTTRPLFSVKASIINIANDTTVPLIQKLQFDSNNKNTIQTQLLFTPKDNMSFLNFSNKSRECLPTDPLYDGPTCCTIGVTERYCQNQCTKFGVDCSLDCDLSILYVRFRVDAIIINGKTCIVDLLILSGARSFGLVTLSCDSYLSIR